MKTFQQFNFKKLIPHITAIVVFIIIGAFYFSPSLEGKKLGQTDILKGKGMQQEIVNYNKTHNDVALWTNSMFGGMPAYQIATHFWSNFQFKVRNAVKIWMPDPLGYFMLYTIGFYILMLVLGVNPWLSIFGALAFAFSSYNFIIIEAGHIWKVRTIGLMAPTLAGFILIFKQKYKLGLIISTLFLSLQLVSNHIQMTYYFFLLVGIYITYQIIETVKTKQYKTLLVSLGVLLVSMVISFGINADRLWTTSEYSQYTIRGKSELTLNKHDKSSGLDKSYITNWSYGKGETFSLLIPNIKGGASGYLADSKEALKKASPNFREQIAQQSHYWGDQPFTSGPVYFGAFIMFLFVLGMFIVKDKIKWVLLIATIFSILLAWGKNFMPLTDFFIDYFPLYNKFRAVTSILVIAGLCVPILALMALNKVINKPEIITKNYKALLWSFGLTGGLSLLFYLLPHTFFNFISDGEAQYFNSYKAANPSQVQGLNEFVNSLVAVRIQIFKSDALRSFFFITLGSGLLLLFVKNILKKNLLYIGLIILILADMVSVDKRYLNNDDFKLKNKVASTFTKSNADKYILNDKSLDYRVLNIATNPFTETSTSYYHKSLGGYHGAKLKRYQELIEYQLAPELDSIRKVLKNNPTPESINNFFKNAQIINMLNTKYIIYNPNATPLINPYAYGNAWLVNNVKIVDNADQEILSLSEFNLKNTLILDKRFKNYTDGVKTSTTDSTEQITLKSYSPNKLVYNSYTNSDRIAVFSEIYYPAGWNVYINGTKINYIRANYLLRVVKIPKGKNVITWKFEPKSYFYGKTISQISVSIFILILLYWLFLYYKNNIKNTEKPLSDNK